MTEARKHALLYGGGLLVVGIAAAYVYSKKQAAATTSAVNSLGTDGAIPNTVDFGADFAPSPSIPDFGGLGEPVADWGPGAVTTLPPPYVEPAPVTIPKRKRCGCCPSDSQIPASQINAELAPLLNQMYHSAAVSEWSV